MNTAERLKQYYNFDDDVLARVSDAANHQNRHKFDKLYSSYMVRRETPFRREDEDRRQLEYLSIYPFTDYDETAMRVYFAPMATPADENMAMRAMRLFEANKDLPLLVVGSPALIGNRANRILMKDAPQIWRGDLRPVIEPTLRMLEEERVTKLDVMGYSYGAEAAMAAASDALEHGIVVEHVVSAEPIAIAKRGLVQLVKDFARSGAPLDDYVKATDSTALLEARAHADKGFARYAGGMLRLSNIAIAHALAQDGFLQRCEDALLQQPRMESTIAWGSASELTTTEAMSKIVLSLTADYGSKRVSGMNLTGMHHAGGDDIDLHAAIMTQGLASRS